ncbi:MAG: hypothetical protein M1818_005556 [Claussenomyces sp. TS43310]|nr:MAG: hypothetical protein M1818_005556 [Claussenomyces sp. TS43310]
MAVCAMRLTPAGTSVVDVIPLDSESGRPKGQSGNNTQASDTSDKKRYPIWAARDESPGSHDVYITEGEDALGCYGGDDDDNGNSEADNSNNSDDDNSDNNNADDGAAG